MGRLNSHMHPLLTDTVIKSLSLKNINTIANFIETEIKHITAISSLSYKDVLNVRKHLINKNAAVVQSGLTYYQQLLQKSALLQTGIKSFDSMLQGGLMTGNIFEICGLPASGKTQFCLTITKNIVQNLDHYVYYIDTKRDFSAHRMKEMLEASHVTEEGITAVMLKILVKQITTKYDLINCLYGIKEELCAGVKLRLIIIDSLPPLFYQTTNHVKNYCIMNHVANIIYLLSKEYHIVFVVTNTITTWSDSNFKTTEKLGLGKYWSNIANTRILIKRNTNSQFEFLILESNNFVKNKKCTVTINEMGMF